MRYYGEDYLQELNRSISAVRDSVETRNYAVPINTAPVGNEHHMIRERGVNASRQAGMHIIKIKNKLDRLQEVLDTFYADADETGSNIIEMADIIKGIIQESNDSLTRMSRMLRGVGEYRGQAITPEGLRSIGINVNSKKRYEDFWIMVLDTDLMAGNVREELVDIYLDRLGSAKEVTLTAEDTKRMDGLIDHYSILRFGETNDIRDLDPSLVKRCIKIYEYRYPENAKIVKGFFKKPLKKKDKTINLNIDRIKYALYTGDPELREIILHYLKKLKLADYTGWSGSEYVPGEGKINLNLISSYEEKIVENGLPTDPFASFFHEVGHGIDELATGEKKQYITSGIKSILINDVKRKIGALLTESGIALDKEQKKTVIDYVVGASNANVVRIEGGTVADNLPKEWTDEMKDSVEYLRDYYGCMEIVCNDHEFEASWHKWTSDAVKIDLEHKLITDIVGAATNNMVSGIPFGHPADFIRTGIPRERTVEGLMDELISESYWYETDHSMKNNIEREFFAEYFNDKFLGFNMDQALDYFSDSSEVTDRIIDDIYDGVSSE